MFKLNQIVQYKGINYQRVSKRKLEDYLINQWLFKGERSANVYCLPCNANIFSEWIEFFCKSVTTFNELEKWLNEVSYYNCNNELGNKLHYFIVI